ncbi:MAG: c-type cytochrome [Gammaproteobacteria bacterium]
MTAEQDRKFFDMFMIVLGILVAMAIGIYGLAQTVQARTQDVYIQEDGAVEALVEDRIKPIGQIAIAGEDNSGLRAPGAGSAAPAPAAAPAQMAADMSGEEVYNSACAACHTAGIAGAPKLGDAAAWGPRVAQGMDTMVDHAINGFQGKAGYMPPKGGRTDLSDGSIRNAVEYMVSQSE